jgi:hypothetical protein
LFLTIILLTTSDKLGNLTVAGVAGAGIAFALQK